MLVVYAENASGVNRSISPTGKEWVLYHEYNGNIPALDSISGTWVKYIGYAGSDGQSIYPVYADDVSGTNQSFIVNNRGYVTFYESINKPTLPLSDETFVKWEGTDGVDGQKGDRGPGRFTHNITLDNDTVPNVSSDTVDYFDMNGFDINSFDFHGVTDFSTHALTAIQNALSVDSTESEGDIVTIVYTKANGTVTSKTGIYSNGLWTEFVIQLDGNELVADSVASDKIQSYNLQIANSSFENNIIQTQHIGSNTITYPTVVSAVGTINSTVNVWTQIAIASINIDNNAYSANIINFSAYVYIVSGGSWVAEYRILRDGVEVRSGKYDVSSSVIGTTISDSVIDTNVTLGATSAYSVEIRGSGNITSTIHTNNRQISILGVRR